MKGFVSALSVKKGDLVILAFLVLIVVVWFAFSFRGSGGMTATVYVDGKEQLSVSLDELEDSFRQSFEGCEILFEPDGVTVISSDCRNQLCVKEGKLKSGGSVCACVPNRVVVVLAAERSKVDAVTY